MATSSIEVKLDDVKLERLGLDWDLSLMLPSWLAAVGPCTAPFSAAPLAALLASGPGGPPVSEAGAPLVRSPELQPTAAAGPVRAADDEAEPFTWTRGRAWGEGAGAGAGAGEAAGRGGTARVGESRVTA